MMVMSVRSAFSATSRRGTLPDATLGTTVITITASAILLLATSATLFLGYPTLSTAGILWYLASAAIVHAGTLVGLRRPLEGLALASLGMLGLALPIPPAHIGLTTGILLPSAAAYLLSIWQGASSEQPRLPAITLTTALLGNTVVAVLYWLAYPGSNRDVRDALLAWVSYGVPILAVFGVATLLRRRRVLRREQSLARQRDAVQSERAAIRRDLHDIVSHSLTVMIAQAEAGRITTTDAADDVSLERIADTGREALRGLRGMIAVLSDSEHADRAPTPPPSDLQGLVASSSTDHHRTHFTVDGAPRPLTPEASLALYRGVQEALTNAIRHVAPPAEIEVAVRWDDTCVTAKVHDDGGTGPAHPGDSPGTGLIGMAERVRAAGGTLGLSQHPGWTVTITLPVERP